MSISCECSLSPSSGNLYPSAPARQMDVCGGEQPRCQCDLRDNSSLRSLSCPQLCRAACLPGEGEGFTHVKVLDSHLVSGQPGQCTGLVTRLLSSWFWTGFAVDLLCDSQTVGSTRCLNQTELVTRGRGISKVSWVRWKLQAFQGVLPALGPRCRNPADSFSELFFLSLFSRRDISCSFFLFGWNK